MKTNGEPATPGTPGNASLLATANTSVTRKESYKLQRKNYRFEKKKAANELLFSLKDPSVVVLADWLKGNVQDSSSISKLA